MHSTLRRIAAAASALLLFNLAPAEALDDLIYKDGFDVPPGSLVFVMPPDAPPEPPSVDLEFATRLQSLDMYAILDRSGSMSSEITTVKNNLATVVNNLTCPPLGTGDPATCIPDLWAGAGTVAYNGSDAQAFQSWVDLQPSPNFAGLPTTEPSTTNTMEALNFSVYATITGSGGAAFGMPSVPARATCSASPAAVAGYATFGYPCFRQGPLPVVLLVTDEPPISPGDTYKSPDWNTIVRPQMLARRAKLVGILGSGSSLATQTDLRTMATDTGAVDTANGNAPVVFFGADANAANAIRDGILTLANGVPIDLSALPQDDPSDSVDAIAAFVERIETLQLGTASCANGLTEEDGNGDTFPDRYLGVRAGTPVCWRLVTKMNTTVASTAAWQFFHATVPVVADGVTTLETRDVYFLVPPDNGPAAIRD
jgi:hypothetical protein